MEVTLGSYHLKCINSLVYALSFMAFVGWRNTKLHATVMNSYHYWDCKYQTALVCSSASLKWNWTAGSKVLVIFSCHALLFCAIPDIRRLNILELWIAGSWILRLSKKWLLKQLHLDSRGQSSLKKLLAFQFLIAVKSVFLRCLLHVSKHISIWIQTN